jgi:hypothetical protein
MDSLMAVELRDRLQGALGLTLASTVAFDHPNADALALHLARELGSQAGVEAPAAPAVAAPSPGTPVDTPPARTVDDRLAELDRLLERLP